MVLDPPPDCELLDPEPLIPLPVRVPLAPEPTSLPGCEPLPVWVPLPDCEPLIPLPDCEPLVPVPARWWWWRWCRPLRLLLWVVELVPVWELALSVSEPLMPVPDEPVWEPLIPVPLVSELPDCEPDAPVPIELSLPCELEAPEPIELLELPLGSEPADDALPPDCASAVPPEPAKSSARPMIHFFMNFPLRPSGAKTIGRASRCGRRRIRQQ